MVVWLSWLERRVHIAEVSGSNPLTTTWKKNVGQKIVYESYQTAY